MGSGVRYVAMTMCCLSMVLAGCSGGSSAPATNQSNNTPLTGQIMDSYIQGLHYQTDSLNGTTDSTGRFQYMPGETVSFYIGDIEIGSTPAKAVVTPFDFVPNAKNATDPVISNILRFLITLDNDDNPDNGIVIEPAVASAATGLSLDFTMTSGFDQAASTVLTDITGNNAGGAKTALVDISVVQTHIRSMLGQALQGQYAGKFSGSADSGTWSFNVDNTGGVTGSSTSSNSMMAMAMSGTLNDNGSFTLSGTDTGSMLNYQGKFDYEGGVTGSWGDGGSSGSFTNSGIGGGLDNSISVYSIDFGNRVFMPTVPMQQEIINPVTRYSFYNTPDGSSTTFTPNYDMINFAITVNNPSGAISSIVVSYYNTGNTSGATHLNYNYQAVCGASTPDPCATVTFDPNKQLVSFNGTRLPPIASTPDFPIAATSDVVLTGSLHQ